MEPSLSIILLAFAFGVGFVFIIPPFGIVSPVVISRAMPGGMRGVQKTLPLILAASLGDGLICVMLMLGFNKVGDYILTRQMFITKSASYLVLVVAAAMLINIYQGGKPADKDKPPSKSLLAMAFSASFLNPANYLAFGWALVTAASYGQPTDFLTTATFCGCIFLGCLAAWIATAAIWPKCIRAFYRRWAWTHKFAPFMMPGCLALAGVMGMAKCL